MNLRKILYSGVAVLSIVGVAWAANNFRMTTSGGTVTTFKGTDNAGVMTPHVNVDSMTTSTSSPELGPVPAGTATATKEVIVGGEYRTTKPTFADTNQGPLQFGTRGAAITQFALPDSASPVTSQAVGADAVSNTYNAYLNTALGYVFNGTTWDRTRSAIGTTGIPAVNTEGTKATYSAAGNVTMAATVNGVVTIYGSATKTVRVTRVGVTGRATANTSTGVIFMRHSAAFSGGTSTLTTMVPHDSASAAATATNVRQYTADPTNGTVVGNLRQTVLTFTTSATSSVSGNPGIQWTFGDKNDQAAVLRGIAEGFSINFGGGSVGGGILHYEIEWTEE